MSTDEEYLDNLLKSMEENLQEKTVFTDIMPEEDLHEDPNEDQEEESHEEIHEELHDELPEEQESKSEINAAFTEDEKWKESLDELLAAAELTVEDSDQNSDTENNTEKEELNSAFDAIESNTGVPDSDMLADMLDNMDVTQLIDGMDSTDEDLAEINDLLKKSDNNESIDTPEDEDVMALLDSIREEDAGSAEAEDVSGDKKKKGLSSLFTKKKKSEKKEDKKEKKDKTDKTDKPKGFFENLFEQLTREEEEPEEEKLSENEEILKELESEDKAKTAAKKGKKEKKKKEKKSKKGKKDGNASAEEDEGAEENVDKKGKKKKPKKEKKKKEKKEEPKEKPVKILSRKALFSLIAFCATIIAAIVLLSIFLPDYSDKKNARNAFYAGDYSEVYELLYGKNLNRSDELIFNRANVVLKLQRRLDSYEINKKTGKEAEALDALLQGVLKYEELNAGETYGASDELMALYWQILDHLSDDYGISEEEAIEINTYDSNAYSQTVYSIINGENTLEISSEEDAIAILEDILPEEEDIIQTEQ